MYWLYIIAMNNAERVSLNYVSVVEIDETDPIHTNQYSIEFLRMHFKS